MRAILAVVLVSAATGARALQTDVGSAASQFLSIGAGARALGMGEAYAAAAEGPDAVYWNPAGLGRMRRPEAEYARTELPAGLHHDFLAVGAPVEWLHGTLALAVTRQSQDSLELVNANNQNQGSFSPHSEVYALAYGCAFARDEWKIYGAERPYEDEPELWAGEIAAGLSVKAINEDLGTRSASTFAVDGGGLFRPEGMHELILAGAFRNIGGKIKFISDAEPLPGELAASAAYEARSGEWRLLPAVEAAVPYAGNAYGKLGFEASKPVGRGMSAAARVGYNTRTSVDLGVLSGFTAGVGVRAGSLAFDAAFQPMSVLGESLRLGVGWKF